MPDRLEKRRRDARRTAAVTALVLAAAIGATAAGAVGGRSAPTLRNATAPSSFPPPVVAAFTPAQPRRLARASSLSHYAPVRRRVAVRIAPDPSASVEATLSPRTPEGTDNIVEVIAHRQRRSGAAWVRVLLAVLPNGTEGWVPRRALGGYGSVATRLNIDLRLLRATLYRNGRPVFRAPIGAGAPSSPTPAGRFYIRNRLSRYRSRAYGPVAFGTSARSPTATDWPAGGYVGIHGTDRPDLLPGHVSHGCIRMRNVDISRLARLMPIGTPLTIH
jgi:lipoprotein-anchoring transpeptidase ErfK/SrfK